ncbi:dethiobiotin synthase [Chromobacterium phragmitis]|uniref:ATP-dependent dethiobiotin synthetase BioD n=1 Tax=Chromobacterium phragmitis TaxID=2202141 RepID=A0A344UI24_9NEIS|nr:dethiobiotin synthase [Chromobacterium phragmitis]AXE29544.1 dethiobiotin synthase [Chromobacterium phragmitis]AXE34922.1 dethiobiotin synthase [Chromobacterium phragmitis]
MSQGFFITGTDTEIGKTHSAVALIRLYQEQGKRVLAMKPVASGCEILPDGSWWNDDVARLTAATGQTDLEWMNPYRFLPPVSPHIAAREAGVEIELPRIVDHYRRLQTQADIVLVEGAGGWLAPLSDSLFMSDMARSLGLPVILVVGMRLGCINHALLTAKAVCDSGLELAGWVANCAQPPQAAYTANLDTLKRHIPAPLLLEIPYQPAA